MKNQSVKQIIAKIVILALICTMVPQATLFNADTAVAAGVSKNAITPGDGTNARQGWYKKGGYTYYYKDGKKVHGLVRIDGKRYIFDDKYGRMLKGWRTYNKKKYYLSPKDGHAITGKTKIDGKIYIFSQKGIMYKGWKTYKGKKYYLSTKTGRAYIGKNKIKGKYYYFNKYGMMQTGWKVIGKSKYYFKKNGSAAIGKIRIGKGLYYFSKKGIMQTGWRVISGKRYYFNKKSGKAVSGWKTIKGKKYHFSATCVANTGWKVIDGKKYFFDKEKAYMYDGVQTVDKDVYYFKKGVLQYSGLIEIGDVTYYFDETTGKAVKGNKMVGDDPYYFNETTGILTGCCKYMNDKRMSLSSATDYMIIVDTSINATCIYKKHEGKWAVYKYFRCTTGAPNTPTVKGEYTVGIKGVSFSGANYTCWYYTQISGNYLFHSVLYQRDSLTSFVDARIGMNLSHGCVRLPIEKSKWIYDNIPTSTKVFIY